jgi:predicted dehydrogenase
MGKIVKWGILGTGRIAGQFANALALVPDARLVAVGSRSQSKAVEFGQKYNVPNIHDSYLGLATDPNIDAIYVATPHVLHCENTLLCLENGKSVVCEKPFAMNEREVRLMIDMAHEKNLFLMEAMWTRFLPSIRKIEEMVNAGQLGELIHLKSDFGFRPEFNLKSRLFDPQLGGGSLLDIGIYPVFIALFLMGVPDEINSKAILSAEGVDTSISINFKYNSGKLATLYSSILTNTPIETDISGSLGHIRIQKKWHTPSSFVATINGIEESFSFDVKGDGYEYEAMEATRCIQEGLIESPLLTHEFSLQLIRILDTIRFQNGIVYKSDKN